MEIRSESDASPVWGPLVIYIIYNIYIYICIYIYTNTHTKFSNTWI